MLFVSTSAGVVRAQDTVAVSPTATRDSTARTPWRGALTFSPFAAILGFVTGDVEFVTSESMTLGVGGGSAFDSDFDFYRSLEGKVRFYPNGQALRGFSVALSGGVASRETCCSSPTGGVTRRAAPTFASDVSYQWLEGRDKRFVIVGGVGLKRFFDRRDESFGLDFLPTARVNIGVRF
jgi:hypothetical protein